MQFDLQTSMSALVFLGALTPFLTAILTRFRDPDWFKGIVSISGAALVGLLSTIENSSSVTASEVLQSGGVAWLVHLATYFGVSSQMVARLSEATKRFAPIALKYSSSEA